VHNNTTTTTTVKTSPPPPPPPPHVYASSCRSVFVYLATERKKNSNGGAINRHARRMG